VFIHMVKIIILALGIFTVMGCGMGMAGGYSYDPDKTVVGSMRHHTIAPKETILDVARNFGLGFNEIQLLYPEMDPWIPDSGRCIDIPTRWILPPTRHHGVVINLPELRMYHFFPKIGMVTTFPIGIGNLGWETPVATGTITDRKINPVWVVPKSLRPKYGFISFPPGPGNPLGKYWVGLSLDGYGIHGTNIPWGIGRLVSHGCIRLYPEHIAVFFEEVYVGVPFEIIYEPVKIGIQDGNIFMEVHPDIYNRIPDMAAHIRRRLKEIGLWSGISHEAVANALQKQSGIPVRVGCLMRGGDVSIISEASKYLTTCCLFNTKEKKLRRKLNE
jgi:L,D-transpeptidase ErfK/SrfK